jgi:hypothetical protein
MPYALAVNKEKRKADVQLTAIVILPYPGALMMGTPGA